MDEARTPDEISPPTLPITLPDPLRADVRLLGRLLGQVLVESVGPDLLDDVERLRALTRAAHNEQSPTALSEAIDVVEGFTLERAEEVARAFSCYFHLSNLAEEYHRVRVFRRQDGKPEGQSFDVLTAAVKKVADELGDEEAKRRLAELEFHPVLTAHPTEARRRAVAASIRRISQLLSDRDDPRNGETWQAELERDLLREIDTLWRTAPIRTVKPSPVDEIYTAIGIFETTLFDVLPEVYRQLDDHLKVEGAGTTAPIVKPFVHFGSWIGADRDGNPNVTAKITRQAAAVASDNILHELEIVAKRVGRTLTMDEATTPPTRELQALWAKQRQLSTELTEEQLNRAPGEPHRRVMLVIAGRIKATRNRDADLAYLSAEELLADLRVVQRSLHEAGSDRAAYGELQKLIWRVETFGFHLMELEVRQHSKVHQMALDEIDAGGDLSPMTLEVLEVFRTISHIQKRYGLKAARRYIISFTQSSQDISNVYRLAREASVTPEDVPVLDVIPLFETFADLQNSTTILDEMLRTPEVLRRLEQTDRRMEIMLGYSDSSKDVGPVAATLVLYDAQERIAEWAKHNDITLTLFHGRGGALGRGGGPAHQAVQAQPPGSVSNRFKLTEQGEVIFARYGDPVIGFEHVQEMAAATLLASLPSTERRNSRAADDFRDMAAIMDRRSRERFFQLVKADGFAPWFSEVTPQEEVGWLALGSRPARRGLSVESLEDLRAIPWVFAWSQARINLAGWYGLGSALEAVGDVEHLQDAYRRWPLFSSMIDNVEMSLAKTDERIAERYLALGDRDDLAALVLEEMRLTKEWVLKTTGETELLELRPVLGRALQVRSPYVDALSLIQLRALGELRAKEFDPDSDHGKRLRQLMMLSVSGVSAGLQNTG